MRFIITSLILFAPLSSFATGTCGGNSKVSLDTLLAHFSAGATTAALGNIKTTATFRQCNSLTQCTDWAIGTPQVIATSSELWEYDYNSSEILSFAGGNGTTPLSNTSSAQLKINQNQVSLVLDIAFQDMLNSKLNHTTSANIQYNSTTQTFLGVNAEFFGTGWSSSLPSTATPFCQRDGMHNSCLIGYGYSNPTLDVAEMKNAAQNRARLQSVTWGEHCFEATYQQIGDAQADGSHFESQLSINGNF